jgi:phosphopantetheine--protein transferase-like protein
MRVNVGCDIVKVARIEKMMQDQSIINKVFHPSELTRYDAEHLAGIFAAKEATVKALGLKPGSWLDIEITNESNGRPLVSVSSEALNTKTMSLDCSISHDDGMAFSVVTVLK